MYNMAPDFWTLSTATLSIVHILLQKSQNPNKK